MSILKSIKEIGRGIFTTRELSSISGKSLSTTTQSLNNLVKQEFLIKICRGVWAKEDAVINPCVIIPHLFPIHRAYVSFISALHMHGIIEQIPSGTTREYVRRKLRDIHTAI